MQFKRVKLLREERGVAALEFALTLPTLMLILLGTVDLGRLGFYTIGISNAAREGAATCIYASITDCTSGNTTYGTSAIQTTIKTEGGSHIVPAIQNGDITITFPTAGTNEYLTVQVQYGFSTLIPWPGIPSTIEIVQRTRMPIAPDI